MTEDQQTRNKIVLMITWSMVLYSNNSFVNFSFKIFLCDICVERNNISFVINGHSRTKQ